jgi:uroporphyrinogen-III synthase
MQDPTVRLAKVPFYVVGPATFRSLSSVTGIPPTQILGAHTGSGEALAQFILTHYATLYPDEEKPPLLFLVGEQRRDVIPKTLGANGIAVEELVVYETGITESFEENFKAVLSKTELTAFDGPRWAVVFSPAGCEAMLRSLHLLDPEERAQQMAGRRRTLVATIGPTTRDFLRDKFGFDPDVCAASPSAEGLGDGIAQFLEKSKLLGSTGCTDKPPP